MTDDVRAAAERITRSVHEAVYTGPLSLQGKLADALIVADAVLAEHPADDGEAERFSAWAFLRTVLERGAAIQQDYAAGNHGSYEVYSARMDAVARDFAEQLKPHLRRQSP